MVSTLSVSLGAQTSHLCIWPVEASELATSDTTDVELSPWLAVASRRRSSARPQVRGDIWN